MISVTQLKSGNFHAKVFLYKDENGKDHYKSVTAPTKTEVKQMVAEITATKKTVCTSTTTFEQAASSYLSVRKNVLSPSTYVHYEKMRKNYFDSVNAMQCKNITDEDAQRFVDNLSSHLAPKTVRNIYTFFVAVVNSVSPFNPKVKLPQKKKHEIEIPTDGEIEKLMEAVKDREEEAAIALGAFCGMRRGEICAVEWSDFDPKKKLLTINKALAESDGDSKYVVKGTKTTAGTRVISVPNRVCKIIEKQKNKSGRIVNLSPDSVYKRYERALKKAELPHYSFHALRHYCCSVMLSLNIPKNYIADFLGHETENMINQVYGHIMVDYKQSYNDILNKRFDNEKEK